MHRQAFKKPSAFVWGPGGAALWWPGYSDLTVAELEELPFYASLSDHPEAPTVGTRNDVTTLAELHAITGGTGGDGATVNEWVHLLDLDSGNAYVNKSHVRMTSAPGVFVDGVLSTASQLNNAHHVEVDGGSYRLAMRLVVTQGIGGNDQAAPEHVVHRRCNLRKDSAPGSPVIHQGQVQSAFVDCRIYGGLGVSITVPSGTVINNMFFLNCRVMGVEGTGDEAFQFVHSDTVSSFAQIVVWQTHMESTSGGTYETIVLDRVEDVAFMQCSVRDRPIEHGADIGTNICYYDCDFHSSQSPVGNGEPTYWEYKRNTWDGITQSTFETALGVPDDNTGSTWSGTYVAPGQWPLSIGHPQLTGGLSEIASVLHSWFVPEADAHASGSGPLITLVSGEADVLDDLVGAADLSAPVTAARLAYSATGGEDDGAYIEMPDVADRLVGTVSMVAGHRTALYTMFAGDSGDDAERKQVALYEDAVGERLVFRHRDGGASDSFGAVADFDAGTDFDSNFTSPSHDTAWHLQSARTPSGGAESEIDGAATTPDFSNTNGLAAANRFSLGDGHGGGAASGGKLAAAALADDPTADDHTLIKRYFAENFQTVIIS